MHIFLLLSIPLCTAWLMLTDRKYSWKSFVPQVIIGAFIAAAICFIKKFFIFSNHLFTDYMADSVTYLLLHGSLGPSLLLCILFMLISKDDWEYKTQAFFPLCASFHAVFLPFTVLTGKEPHAAFLIFLKPLIMTSLCIYISTCATSISRAIYNRKKTLLCIFIPALTVSLILPSFIETLWYFQLFPFLLGLLCAVYMGGASFMLLFTRKNATNPHDSGQN